MADAIFGQARKSLWIETSSPARLNPMHLVRLVRACGSKRRYLYRPLAWRRGQARKSLWIETFSSMYHSPKLFGQARKSLWIET